MPCRVILFKLTGCQACDEFFPVFQDVAARNPRIGTRVYDGADRRTWPAMEQLDIDATPTTIVVTRDRVIAKREGALSAAQLQRLFDRARAG